MKKKLIYIMILSFFVFFTATTSLTSPGSASAQSPTNTRTPTPINIGNFVWDDLDQDGTQDAGEPGLAGVSVQLWNSAKNQLLNSTSTNASGGYTLVAPIPGNYRVRVVLPSASDAFSPKDAAGNDQTDSDINPSGIDLGFTDTFNIASNVISTTIYDAGIIKFRTPTPTRTPTPINIGNFVWDDLDQDGTQDAGEPGLAGVSVQLWNSAKNQLLNSTSTNASGGYTLVAPIPGNYRVRVVLPSASDAFSPKDAAGNDQTDSDINPSGVDLGFTDTFNIASNVISTTIYDAGIIKFRTATPTRTPTPINIGNFVWYDLDGDGIQDAGEPGIAGITVQLWNAAKNNLIFSAVTGANGNYTVIAPVPGDYRVRVVPFSGSSFSPKNQGADDTKDSDINASIFSVDYGFSDIFTIATNVISTTIYDAGLTIVGPTSTPTRTPTPVPGVIPSPWTGGVSIASDQSVVAVARPHLGSEVASYIGATAGSTTQYVPMLFKGAFGGTYNAALYIQNVSATAATLSLEFTDSTGAVVYTKVDTLDPHASKGYWLPAEVGLPSGFAGGVKVASTQPILAVGRPHINGQVMTYNGMSSGATSAWLPMFFKNGFGSYNTALYVQNVTGSSANLSIQYINLDGTVACTDNDTLGANASKGYWSLTIACDTGSLPSGFVGGVKVTSTQNILAVGRAHLGTQITTYNGSAAGATSAYLPMLFKNAFSGGSYDAAIYLQNVSGSSASVQIEYLNSAGAVAATQNVTLAANAISSIWLPSVVGLADDFAGGARITSTQNVIAVARPHLGSEISAYNGAPVGSLNAYLPMLFKNAYSSYQSAFYIQNTSGSAANVDISFYDSAGVLSCVKPIDLAAGAIQGFWMPTVTCAP